MLAAILRHGKFSLPMNEQGFVDMRDIVDAIRGTNDRYKWLRPYHVEALALTDPKGRYQIRGRSVRATYGHTIKLDLGLPVVGIPEFLYYPVSAEEADIIMETGILPTDRAMVHLSATYENAFDAGEVRVEEPVILTINAVECAASGHVISKASPTVYLCDMVPAEFISVAEDEGED